MEGEQSEIVGRGGKLLRSGANEQEWHGVGIVLSNEVKEDLISVSRNNDSLSDEYRPRIRRDGS